MTVSSTWLLLVPEAPVTALQTGGVSMEMVVELVATETGVARLNSSKLRITQGWWHRTLSDKNNNGFVLLSYWRDFLKKKKSLSASPTSAFTHHLSDSYVSEQDIIINPERRALIGWKSTILAVSNSLKLISQTTIETLLWNLWKTWTKHFSCC